VTTRTRPVVVARAPATAAGLVAHPRSPGSNGCTTCTARPGRATSRPSCGSGTGRVSRNRRKASTLPGNWRTRLTEAQQSELHRVLSLLPVLTGGEYGER
jgi:hypothetical protein